MELEQILQEYYAQEGKKLRRMVDKIVAKFGGIYQKDYDDFYSLANELVADICKTYDGTQDFDGYVYSCLSNKIKSEITRRNRDKRKGDREAISLDMPIQEDGSETIGDILASDFDIEKELAKEHGTFLDERMEQYLDRLTKVQRRIVEMKMEDLPALQIREWLGVSEKEYRNHCRQIKSFSNTRLLFETQKTQSTDSGEDMQMEIILQTAEKSKQKSYSISSIIKKIENYTIRFDHPTQRESEQWSPKMKGNLISDILQGNPIPALVFAEQIIDGLVVIWDLDGKQRCTNVYNFAKDGFKISKNIRRWMIPYQTRRKDADGKLILGKNKLPQFEWKECDIRGKKYSDLPEELQEKFNDYTFEVTQYLNCSSEDIVYHISRYNEGKPMTPSQKGLACLGEEYAALVKGISNMDFFKDNGDYKVSEFRNGTINRVVVESVMASDFLEDWKKQQEEMCDYIRNNAAVNSFDHFEEMVERLTRVVTEEVSVLFNSKDSFLWFGLFARFTKSGLDDGKFVEFMSEFARSLHCKKQRGVSFDDLNGKSTKDKSVVIGKINHLTELMNEFLQLGKEEDAKAILGETPELVKYVDEFKKSDVIRTLPIKSETDYIRVAMQSLMLIRGDKDLSDKAIRNFVVKSKSTDLNGITEDVMLYLDIFNDWSLNVDNDSELFDKENIPVLLGFVSYSCAENVDELAEKWFQEFALGFGQKSRFGGDKRANYRMMVAGLNRRIKNSHTTVAV